MSVRAPVGPVNFATQEICIGRGLVAIRTNGEKINPVFLFHFLKANEYNIKGNDGAIFSSINRKDIQQIKIPLPPLKIQQEIVAEIEGWQKIIDGARSVVDNYKPQIQINPDWKMVKLGDVCDVFNGSTPSKQNEKYWENGDIPWFTIEDVRKQGRVIRKTCKKITNKALKETSVKLLPVETILLCCTASVGEYAFSEIELTTNQQFNGLVIKNEYLEKLLPKYLFYISSTFKNELLRLSGKTSFNFVSVKTLKTLKTPLPPLKIQQEIVAKIEKEQSLVNANKELIVLFEKKIKDKIANVWGEKMNKEPDYIHATERETLK